VYSREFWYRLLRRLGLHGLSPQADIVDLVDWWLLVVNVFSGRFVGSSTPWWFLVLGLFGWKGMPVFGSASHQKRPRELLDTFSEQARAWSLAAFVVLSDVIP
jgi:hypothetical protein